MEYDKGMSKEEVLGLVKDLVMIESTTGKEGRISAFIRRLLGEYGFNPITVEAGGDGPPFYIRINGRKQGSVAFVGHMDTVDVKGQDWVHDPFGAQIEGGLMYGRGSSDMKSGLACMIATAVWVSENSIIPEKSLIFAFTIEEEKGYLGARKLTEKGVFTDCELVIIPEPTEGKVHIGQKGQLWVDVTFSGRAAHAALPETGANAAMAAADFAVRANDAFSRFGHKAGLGKSTGSIDEIHGGWQINVVPNTAKVGIDFRVVDHADHSLALAIVDETRAAASRKWEVTSSASVRQYVEPVVSKPDDRMVKGFVNTAPDKEDVSYELGVVAYSTDGSVIIPSCKASLIVFGPGSIKKAHQQEEHLVVDQVFDVLEHMKAFVLRGL